MGATVFLIGWLDGRFDGLPCFGQVPRERPARFLHVQRFGGKVGRWWDEAYLAVRVWAPSMAEADALAVRVARALETRLPFEPEVASADVAQVIPYSADPDRVGVYQITINLTTSIPEED